MREWQWYALFGLFAALAIGFPILNARLRDLRLSEAGLERTEAWTDDDMLSHMARIFGALGYKVQLPDDEAAAFDLILVDGLGHQRGVLLRTWREVITDQLVREVDTAGKELGSASPMLITVERYTYRAELLAKELGVVLWDLSDLAKAMGQVRRLAVAYPDLPGRRQADSLAALAQARPASIQMEPPTARTAMKSAGSRRRKGLFRFRKSK